MAAPSNPIRTTAEGYIGYRGREGHYAFLLHRLTGLGTLLFLIIHILDTSTVYFFPSLYEHAIDIYRSTPFMLGEIALVFSVIYHGVNGLRIAAVDLWMEKRWTIKAQQMGVRGTLAISILLWLPAAALMLKSMLEHNFGIVLFGG
ncbi:MAG: succinate dehydrogenase, cytochrome b556 subunit [Chloroflexi bacterium]|nr:succinate dehydrogenase, cytochrome b556 subunit [Chloroflexota bacterium]